jgi:hypothetical protein
MENQNATDVVVHIHTLLLAVKSLDVVLKRKTLRHARNAAISLAQNSKE